MNGIIRGIASRFTASRKPPPTQEQEAVAVAQEATTVRDSTALNEMPQEAVAVAQEATTVRDSTALNEMPQEAVAVAREGTTIRDPTALNEMPQEAVATAQEAATVRNPTALNEMPQEKPRSRIFIPVGGQYRTASYGMPLTSRPDGKLVVFGLPKSGNVWLVSMLTDYFEMPAIAPYDDVDRTGIGMCHLPYSEALAERADFVHGVYIMRDLRDIIVSYFHHAQRADFRESIPNCECQTIEEFYYEWFLPRIAPHHGVHDHAEQFAQRGIPVIRYEKLYDRPEYEFNRLIRRLGLPVDTERISAVVRKNRLDELQKTGRQLDVFVPTPHFRKGGHGGYKTESIIRHVSQTFGEMLARCGYEV
jgi:hypothetical protein